MIKIKETIEGTLSNNDTKILLNKALLDSKYTDYSKRVNKHKFIEVDVVAPANTLTQMNLSFVDNDNNYHELGGVISSLSLQNMLTQKQIDIQFDDLIALSSNIENGNFTYMIKNHISRIEDASSVSVLSIDHDVVVSVSLKENTLRIVACYGYIDTELDMNNVAYTQVFVVDYQEFLQCVSVVENCIISEAIIQNQLKDNLSTLSAVMKKNIPNLLSTYTRDVSYYIKYVSNLLPPLSEKDGKDLMNFVCNRAEFISPTINTHIVFFNEKFATYDYETFHLDIEQFSYVGTRLLDGSSVSINLKNSSLAYFSIDQNQVVIQVDFYKENSIDDLSYRHSDLFEIDKELFFLMHKIIPISVWMQDNENSNDKSLFESELDLEDIAS